MLHLREMLAKTEPMIKCNGTPFGTHFTPFQDTPRKLPTAFKLCAINHIHSIKPHDDLRIGGYEVTHNGLISILKGYFWIQRFYKYGCLGVQLDLFADTFTFLLQGKDVKLMKKYGLVEWVLTMRW